MIQNVAPAADQLKNGPASSLMTEVLRDVRWVIKTKGAMRCRPPKLRLERPSGLGTP